MTENPKNDFWSQNYMNVPKKEKKNNPENRTLPPPQKPLQKQKKTLNELCKYYLFP